MYLKNKFVHFFVFGSLYMNIEILARAAVKSLVGFNGIKPLSLMGYTSLWMFLVGGTCAVIVGKLNDYTKLHPLKTWEKIFIGGTIITLGELLSGIILNIIFDLHIWEYGGKFQFLGQIELKNCLIWYFVMTPLIIWLDDILSAYIYRHGKPYGITELYLKLILLK